MFGGRAWTKVAMITGAILGGIIGAVLGVINIITHCSNSTAVIVGGIAGEIITTFLLLIAQRPLEGKIGGGSVELQKHQIICIMACIPIGAVVAFISSCSAGFR